MLLRRIALPAVIGSLAFGCAGDVVAPEAMNGTYELTAVQGQSLPATVQYGRFEYVFVRATITFDGVHYTGTASYSADGVQRTDTIVGLYVPEQNRRDHFTLAGQDGELHVGRITARGDLVLYWPWSEGENRFERR